MAENRIKIVVVDGLTADDVLKLKHGGFFDGVRVPLPEGASGIEARVVKPGDTLLVPANSLTPVKLVEEQPSVGGYDANVREALDKAEAAQLAVVEAIKQEVEAKATTDELFPHEPPQPEKKERRKRERAEDRAVERAANAVDEAAAVGDTAQAAVVTDEPKGNGKKYGVQHARQNGRYVVSVFGKKWAGTFIARTKAGFAFKLDAYTSTDTVTLSDGDIVEELSIDGAAAPTDEQAVDTADVDLSIDTLLGFTKLRDLIQYVVSTGIPASGVIAFCESMKGEVPLLQRISNIPERVTRTLEVMGLTGEA